MPPLLVPARARSIASIENTNNNLDLKKSQEERGVIHIHLSLTLLMTFAEIMF